MCVCVRVCACVCVNTIKKCVSANHLYLSILNETNHFKKSVWKYTDNEPARVDQYNVCVNICVLFKSKLTYKFRPYSDVCAKRFDVNGIRSDRSLCNGRRKYVAKIVDRSMRIYREFSKLIC